MNKSPLSSLKDTISSHVEYVVKLETDLAAARSANAVLRKQNEELEDLARGLRKMLENSEKEIKKATAPVLVELPINLKKHPYHPTPYKLTEEEVFHIRELRKAGYPVKRLAKMFEVSEGTIYNHTNGIKNYKSLPQVVRNYGFKKCER